MIPNPNPYRRLLGVIEAYGRVDQSSQIAEASHGRSALRCAIDRDIGVQTSDKADQHIKQGLTRLCLADLIVKSNRDDHVFKLALKELRVEPRQDLRCGKRRPIV